MTDDITVQIPDEDYDIEVKIGIKSIKNALQRAEEEASEQFERNGPVVLDLSKYATVTAEPTDEKWLELAKDD